MTVSFGHSAHLATVWWPELTPTTGKAVSTAFAMLAMAVILTAVAGLFAVFCLEKPFSWARGALTFVASLALIVACGGGLQHVTGKNTVHGATPADSQAHALQAARAAAVPSDDWRESARQSPAAGHMVQDGWTKKDMQKVSEVVATSRGMRLGYVGAPAVLDTKHAPDADVALHGTPYFKGNSKVRCVVTLKNVVKNNVGQPVTAQISDVRCAPAATPAPTTKTS